MLLIDRAISGVSRWLCARAWTGDPLILGLLNVMIVVVDWRLRYVRWRLRRLLKKTRPPLDRGRA